MNWSRIIGNIGRTLIASGVLILLFVVYQLWGTALQERRAQDALRSQFAVVLAEAPGAASLAEFGNDELPARLDPEAVLTAAVEDQDETGSTDTAETPRRSGTVLVDPSALIIDPDATTFGPPPPPPDGGEAIAHLRIPAIGLDKVVVEGVGTNALKKGPGHYPGTPLPGQPGNAAIAGHRTTYGAPFYDLDGLEENDLIYVTTAQGAFQYRVTESHVVSPSDVWVLDPTTDDRLTLTTCNPRYSARERLIVVAELIGPAAPVDPVALGGAVVSLPGEDLDVLEEDGQTERAGEPDTGAVGGDDEEEGGILGELDETDGEGADTASGSDPNTVGELDDLDGDRAAAWPAVFWGLVAGFVWLVTWYAAREWRRWPAYLTGTPVFLVVLFVFFENFSRLLPPGV